MHEQVRGDDHSDGPAARLRRLLDSVETETLSRGLTIETWSNTRTELEQLINLLADARSRTMLREMSHRQRNLVQTAASVADAVLLETVDPDRFSIEFLKRMNDAFSLVTVEARRSNVRTVFEEVLTTYISPETLARVAVLKGELVPVDGSVARALRLAAVELVTNAAKYGAFKMAGGTLQVSWSVAASGGFDLLTINWIEHLLHGDALQHRPGSGTRLLTEDLPHDYGLRVATDHGPHGYSYRFDVQLVRRPDKASSDGPRSILLVDDEKIVTAGMELNLEFAGFRVIIAATESDALAFLAGELPDLAILDRNLGDGTSFAVAAVLKQLSIPFFFLAGEPRRDEDVDFDEVLWMLKPTPSKTIGAVAEGMMG